MNTIWPNAPYLEPPRCRRESQCSSELILLLGGSLDRTVTMDYVEIAGKKK